MPRQPEQLSWYNIENACKWHKHAAVTLLMEKYLFFVNKHLPKIHQRFRCHKNKYGNKFCMTKSNLLLT